VGFDELVLCTIDAVDERYGETEICCGIAPQGRSGVRCRWAECGCRGICCIVLGADDERSRGRWSRKCARCAALARAAGVMTVRPRELDRRMIQVHGVDPSRFFAFKILKESNVGWMGKDRPLGGLLCCMHIFYAEQLQEELYI
jgi:hypothetical protein